MKQKRSKISKTNGTSARQGQVSREKLEKITLMHI